jgi:DNA-binding NarL/FixJ family response regulator
LGAKEAREWSADVEIAAIFRVPATHTATFVGPHEGDGGMGVRSMTVRRFEEIRRRLSEGRGLREIARALGCSRDTVREVRDGLRLSPDVKRRDFVTLRK